MKEYGDVWTWTRKDDAINGTTFGSITKTYIHGRAYRTTFMALSADSAVVIKSDDPAMPVGRVVHEGEWVWEH